MEKNSERMFQVKMIPIREALGIASILLLINPLNYRGLSPVWPLVVFGLWLLVASCKSWTSLKMSIFNKAFMYCTFYLILLLIYSIFREDIIFSGRAVFDVMCLFMILYYIRVDNKFELLHLVKASLVYFALISFNTMFLLQSNKNIAREMASVNNVVDANPFTGGYGTVYSLLFICIALFSVVKCKVKVKENYVRYLIYIIIYSLFILEAQYAMAIMFLVLGISLIMLNKKIIFFVIGIFIVLFLINMENIAELFYLIANYLPDGTFIFSRTVQIGDVIDGVAHGGLSTQTSFGTWIRFEIILDSFELIFEDPLWGVGNSSESLIGKHSSFLDALSGYGIILGGIYIITKFYVMIFLRRYIRPEHRSAYNIIIFIFFLLMLVNRTDLSEISLTLYVIVPFMLGEAEINRNDCCKC